MEQRGLTEKVSLVAFGTGLRALTEIVLAVLLVRLLPQEQYGTYRQFVLITGTLAVFTTLGLPASLYFFVPRMEARSRGELLRRVITLIALCSLSGAALLYVVSDWLAVAFTNPDLGHLLRMGAIYPFGQALALLPPYYLISTSRQREAGLYHVFISILQSLAVVGPALLGFGLKGVVVGGTAFWVIAGLAGCSVISIKTPRDRQHHGSVKAGVLLGYSMPLSLNSMVGTLNARVDRVLVSLFYSPSVFALFSVGATEVPVTSVLTYSVGNVLAPEISRLDEHGSRRDVVNLWHRSIHKLSLVMFPLFFLLLIMADELISLLFTPAYLAAAKVFRIYLLILPLRVAAYGSVLAAMGYSRSVLSGALLGLSSNVVLGLLFCSWFGWTGPAWAAVLSQAIMAAYLVSRIAAAVKQPIWRTFPVGRWLVVGGIALGPAVLLWPVKLLAVTALGKLVMGTVIYGTVYCGVLWRMGWLTQSDLALAKKWISLSVFRR